MKRLCILLMMAVVAGCSPDYRTPNDGKPVAPGEVRLSLTQTDPARAASDARAAVASGDRHLLGVYGYASYVPGADGRPSEFGPENWPAGILYIEDTTDGPRDGGHQTFNDRAVAYAIAYNKVVLASPVTAP
ncbi:hypothetical protein [Brevundimonas sp.]|jgi:hypothetical protein|uniref:hypothetical protein n=1 Tax=Brevundimonas sp. TaxID=1871086 RepID=UPI003A90E00B